MGLMICMDKLMQAKRALPSPHFIISSQRGGVGKLNFRWSHVLNQPKSLHTVCTTTHTSNVRDISGGKKHSLTPSFFYFHLQSYVYTVVCSIPARATNQKVPLVSETV